MSAEASKVLLGLFNLEMMLALAAGSQYLEKNEGVPESVRIAGMIGIFGR